MNDKVKRYHKSWFFARWRYRRAARICGNFLKPWLNDRFGDHPIYTLEQLREAKRDAGINDYEAALAAGLFLAADDFAKAAQYFEFILDQDDARRLMKAQFPTMTILDAQLHPADGTQGGGTWNQADVSGRHRRRTLK